MLNNLKNWLHPKLIQKVGRDRLEYFLSNTMNEGTTRLDSFLWSYDCKAKVIDIIRETENTNTLVLLPNQHFQQPLPGQHIEVYVNVDNSGIPVKRHYTLSHITPDTVSITVKKQPEGKVSNWLHDNAKVGMVFDISSPKGKFIYEKQEKLLFISAGSGITPAYAILNSLATSETPTDAILYYRSQSPDSTIFQRQLGLMTTSKTFFSYSNRDDKWSAADIEKCVEDIKDRSIYLCGPESFKQAVLNYLKDIDYDLSHVRVENFNPVVHKGSDSTVEGDVVITLRSQNVSFVVPETSKNQTILEAAEANGIQMEHGCRTGMCGTCKTHLIEGEVSGNQLGSCVYPCTAYPASNTLVLE